MAPPQPRSQRLNITGHLLARNVVFNVLGQAFPFLIGVASLPTILQGLGAERFGLLVLTWTLLGAFTVFDLGLGWTVTKFVAEALGRNDPGAIPGIVWPAILGQAVLGTIGGAAIILATPAFVMRVLHVPVSLIAEAITTFKVVGVTLPVVLVSMTFRGVLEASQRFDLTTAVKAIGNSAAFIVPLVGVLIGWTLPLILVVLLIVRAFLLALVLIMSVHVLPSMSDVVRVSGGELRRMFAFAGWVTISGIAGIALGQADRLTIGYILGVTAVSYYAVSQELVTRLGVLTASLVGVLFPAFSTLLGAQDAKRLKLLFGRMVKYSLVIVGPAFGLVVVLAPDLLRVWVGPVLAQRSARVLQILAVGAAVQVLGAIPYTALQGGGRSDVTGKMHLLAAPLYLMVMWLGVRQVGIEGAALAWSARVALESLYLFWAAERLIGLGGISLGVLGLVAPPLAIAYALFIAAYTLPLGPTLRTIMLMSAIAAFGGWVWRAALDAQERRWVEERTAQWKRMAARLR